VTDLPSIMTDECTGFSINGRLPHASGLFSTQSVQRVSGPRTARERQLLVNLNPGPLVRNVGESSSYFGRFLGPALGPRGESG